MTLSFGVLPPLFVGPVGFLLMTLLVIGLILLVARVIFGVAVKLIMIGAVILGVLWLMDTVGAGPPAFG